MEEKGNLFKSVPIVSANVIASNNNAVDDLKSAGSGFEINFYVCKICGLSLTSSDALNNHLHSLHVIKRGKDCFPCGCHPCEEIFQTSALLINHLRREHTEQIFSSCGRCGKKFTRSYSVPTHHSSYPPSKIYCNVCVTELKNIKDNVVKVVKIQNNEKNTLKLAPNVSLNTCPNNDNNIDQSKSTGSEGEMDSYICKICHLGFSLSDALDDHLHSSHVITRFSCGSCKEEFNTLEMLMNHLRRDHSEQKINFCSQCGRKFTCSLSIPINRGNTDPPKFYCSQCTKGRENENSQVIEVIIEKNIEENSSDSIFDDATNMSPCGTDVDGFHSASSDDETDSYICQICQHGLSTSDALDDHLRSLHVVKSARGYFSCSSCTRLFKTLAMLINHLRRDHTVQKIHSCGQCGKKLTVSHSVPTHDRKKGPSQIYCGVCIMEPENAKEKIVDVSEEKNCGQDGDILENAVQVLELTAEEYSACIDKKDNTVTSSNNRNIKRKEKKFACVICSKKFWKRATLLNHERKHCNENRNSSEEKHRGQGEKDKTLTSSDDRKIKCKERKFSCGTCSKKFWTEATLLTHQRNHCHETPYSCEFCDKIYSSLYNLGRHLLSHSGEKPYLCEDCGKGFTRKQLLQVHQRRHTGERPYVCDICGKGFIVKALLQDHKFVHTREGPFTCRVCGKTYESRETLSEHFRIHNDGKFACELCPKEYANRSGLFNHQRVHTGEKPYPCEFCDKTFATSSSRMIHRKTHSGERPYVCEACGKTCTQKAHLKTHLLLHTGEKPYECDICRKTFAYKYVLVSHRRIHTGERPFQCDFCQKGFIDKGTLKKHQRTHH